MSTERLVGCIPHFGPWNHDSSAGPYTLLFTRRYGAIALERIVPNIPPEPKPKPDVGYLNRSEVPYNTYYNTPKSYGERTWGDIPDFDFD